MTNDASAMPGPPKPGSEHARLKPMEGRFRTRVTLFMGPNQTHESTGTMVNSFQLDGLYLHQDYVGDPSEGPFPNFAGKGYFGYNTTLGRYEGFWIDNASTTMQFEHGQVDAAGKVWTMDGEVTHPHSKQVLKKRNVITVQDNDHHTMESFFVGEDGKDTPMMVIQYERA